MKKILITLFILIGIISGTYSQVTNPTFQKLYTWETVAEMNTYTYSYLDRKSAIAYVKEDSTLYFWSDALQSWENVVPTYTHPDSIPYSTGAGTPVGVVTPNSVGEHYQDLVTGIIWVSDGITNANWERDVIESDGEVFILGTINLDGAATIGAGQDDYVMKYDHSTQKWGPEPDAGAGGGANLDTLLYADSLIIDNDGGTNAILHGATTSWAGLLIASDKTKLDGIEAAAKDDQTITGGWGITATPSSGDYTIEADTSEVATQYDISGFGNDEDPTNEIQTLTIANDSLFLSGNPDTIDLKPYLDNIVLTQEEVEDYAGNLFDSGGTGTHTGITVTYQDGTGDVDLEVDHDAATNFDIAEHRIINDSGTSATELWSASKISTELAAVSAGGEVNTMALIGTASGDDLYHSKVASELKIKGLEEADGTIVITTDADDVLFGVGTITSAKVSDFDTEVGNHIDVAANTTHRTSDGSDHTFIDQSVISGSSPTFDGNNFTGIDANDVDIADAGVIIAATDVEGALQENRTAINLNTAKVSYPGSADAGELNILDGATLTTAELNKLDGVTATTTEINYIDGVTSPIQNQLNNKLGDIVEDTSPQLGGNLDMQTWNIEGVNATEIAILDGAILSTTELNYVNGVTSSIQTQLDGKLTDLLNDASPQLGGSLDLNGNNIDDVSSLELSILDGATVTTAELNGLDGLANNRAVVTDASGYLTTSAVTDTEVGYLDNVTSNIQTQLDSKAEATKTVESRATDKTLTAAESGEVYYVTTTSAFELPAASAGIRYTFVAAYQAGAPIVIGITPEDGSSDRIEWNGGSLTEGGGVNEYYRNSTDGATIDIICVDGTTWHVLYSTGTWAAGVDPTP